jgi:hypothetical protein
MLITLSILRLQYFSGAEVGDQYVHVFIQQNILWFQVSANSNTVLNRAINTTIITSHYHVIKKSHIDAKHTLEKKNVGQTKSQVLKLVQILTLTVLTF